MLISDANPELHERIRVSSDDEINRLCILMGVERFLPEQSCSSGDAAEKMKKLVDFETDIIFLGRFIEDLHDELDTKEHRCWYLQFTSKWNVEMFDFLHRQLESICDAEEEKSEIPAKSRYLENAYEKLTRHLINKQILQADALDSSLPIYDFPIISRIKDGINFYGYTEAKEAAFPFLDSMLKIEMDHQAVEKLAAENETTLDPSVSKDRILKQIQLLEKLPVDALQAEVEELTGQICPVAKHSNMFLEAQQYILDTFFAMNQAKRRMSNGLDELLDSFMNKAATFKDEWENKYAHALIAFSDHSNPKRQRIKY